MPSLNRRGRARRVAIARSGIVVLAFTASAESALAADAFSTYGVGGYRALSLPPIGGGSFDLRGDFLPDGRIVAVTGLSVFLESAPGAGSFHHAATLDSTHVGGSTDPAFLRVSPDGSSIAIGAGFQRPVAVFAAGVLGAPGSPTPLTPVSVAQYFDVPHFEGAWADSSHLALSAGTFGAPGYVSLLDVRSSPSSPANPVVIHNIGGSSAGVAFDAAGRLYTGNGFDLDPASGSNTGAIRAFTTAEWSGGLPADFEAAGTLVGEVLSAGALAFDAEGNLFVGGGDFPGDAGYLGVLNHAALAEALAGAGPIDPLDVADLRRLDPLGTGMGYFASAFNPLTRELAITSGSTWFIAVPAPASVLLAPFIVLAMGRRSRAYSRS